MRLCGMAYMCKCLRVPGLCFGVYCLELALWEFTIDSKYNSGDGFAEVAVSALSVCGA